MHEQIVHYANYCLTLFSLWFKMVIEKSDCKGDLADLYDPKNKLKMRSLDAAICILWTIFELYFSQFWPLKN